MKRNSIFYLLIIFLSGLLLLFIIAPLVGLIMGSSLKNIFVTAADPKFQESLCLTLFTSAVATVIGAVAAIPLAWLLARHDFPFKMLVTGIIDLPIVIPHTAAGVALLGFISRDTIVGKIASYMGFNLVGSPIGISLAMAFVSIPFLINAARNGFEAVPQRLEQAAATLGASPATILLTVSIPMASRSIIAGLVLMFARGLSEFGAIVVIAYHPMVSAVYLFDRLNNYGLEYATPVAVLILVVSLAVFIISRILSKNLFYARNQRNKI